MPMVIYAISRAKQVDLIVAGNLFVRGGLDFFRALFKKVVKYDSQ